MARRNGGAKAAASPKPAASGTSVVSPTSAAKRKREPEAAEPTPKRAAVSEVGPPLSSGCSGPFYPAHGCCHGFLTAGCTGACTCRTTAPRRCEPQARGRGPTGSRAKGRRSYAKGRSSYAKGRSSYADAETRSADARSSRFGHSGPDAHCAGGSAAGWPVPSARQGARPSGATAAVTAQAQGARGVPPRPHPSVRAPQVRSRRESQAAADLQAAHRFVFRAAHHGGRGGGAERGGPDAGCVFGHIVL